MLYKIFITVKIALLYLLVIVGLYVLTAFASGDPWFLLGPYIPTTIDNIKTTIRRQTPVEVPVNINIIGQIVDLDYDVYTPDKYAITILFAYPKTDSMSKRITFGDFFYGRNLFNKNGEQIRADLDLEFHVRISKNLDSHYNVIFDEKIHLDGGSGSFVIQYPPNTWIGKFISTHYLDKGSYLIEISSSKLLPEEWRTYAKIILRKDFRM